MSDSEDWYYGLDGNPGEDQFDFVSVVLHEIGHGLGFFASFRDEEDGTFGYGFELRGRDTGERFPVRFERFIWDTDSNRLVDESSYSNPSSELVEAITGIKLFWYGLEAAEANGGKDNFILLVGSRRIHEEQRCPPGRQCLSSWNFQCFDEPIPVKRRG